MLNPFALRLGARSLGLLILLVGTLVFALGRGPKERDAAPAPPPPAEEVASPAPAEPILPVRRIHAGALRAALASAPVVEQEALVDGPLALLPPDTVGVMAAASWADTVEELGLASLLDRYRDRLSELDEKLGEAGLTLDDLIDPSALGLDAQGPVALAWLDVRDPVAVAGMRIADPAAFERALGVLMSAAADEGGEGFRTEQLGEAVVTYTGGERPEAAFVRRAGVAFFVARDSWNGSVETVCAQLAFQDPEQGLPTTREWAETMATVRGRSGAAFLNLPAIRAQVGFAIADEQAQNEQMWADGERPEWADRQIERMSASRNLSEGFLGSMRGLGVGVELARGRVEVDARLVLEPGSLLDGLLKNRGLHSHLQRGLDRAPVFLMDGKLDPGALRQLVGLVFAVSGEDFEQVMAVAGKAMNLDGDPFTLLSGELGVAVRAPIAGEDDNWGVSVTLGVNDARAAEDVLDALGALGSLTGALKQDPDRDALLIETPFWRTLHVAVAGGAVVATTDPLVLDRLRGGASPSLSSWAMRPEVASVVGATGEAGVILWDFRGLLPGLAAEGLYRPAPAPLDGLSGLDLELRRVDNRIDELHYSYADSIDRHRRELVEVLGALVFSARSEGPSIAIRGGWAYNAGDARELVTLLVEAGTAIEDDEDSRNAELDPLYEQRRALLDRIAAERPPAPPVDLPRPIPDMSDVGPM